jgi:ubiquitin thioesterase protein OTUB1
MPQDLPPATVPAAVPTYLQYSSHYHEPVYEIDLPDFMATIPGMSFANPHQAWLSSSSYADSDFFAAPTPVQPCAPSLPTLSTSAPQPQMQSAPVFITAPPAHMVPPPTQMPEELAIRTVPHSATSSHINSQAQISSGPFRPSHWEFECDFTQQVPLQTSIFKK